MRAPGAVAALALGTALGTAAPVRAQDPPDHDWETSFAVEIQDFTVDSAPWSSWLETAVGLERVLAHGTVRFEAVESRRFDVWDAAVSMDAWGELWSRAYGNLRLEVAPGAVVRPEVDLAAGLFHGVGRSWELGGGWQRRRFQAGTIDVDTVTLTAARYLDGWYLRGGTEIAGCDGFDGALATGVVRWYLDPPEDLVELGAAWGESIELGGTGPVVLFGRGGHAHLRFQTFPWPYVGFGLAAEVRTFEGLPVRHGVSASLRARW